MTRYSHKMISGILVLALLGGLARAGENMIQNGDFSQGVVAAGWPKSWECSGDGTVRQTLALVNDPERGPCARLECTAIGGGGPAGHAMVAQKGTVALQADTWYRISFWARQEGIPGGSILVGISDMKTWSDSGIRDGVRVTGKWRQFAILKRSRINAPAANTRLLIWHTTTGTLWIDDVAVAETDPPQRTVAPMIETQGRKNLVPNGSFECGPASWSGVTERAGWGNLNGLIGEIDTAAGAPHGGRCLKVTLNEKTTPVLYFDYFELTRRPILMPLAANVGWIPLEKGADYTLSAWLKADRPGVRGVLAVYFGESPALKTVALTEQWRRYSFTLKARGPHGFVAAGPDLRAGPNEATVWLDGVQLEKGAAPTGYAPSDPVEAGIETQGARRVFDTGEELNLAVTAFNDSDAPATVKVTVRFTDFFDAPAGEKVATLELNPKSGTEAKIAAGLTQKGFYRARIRSEAGGRVRERSLRLSIIEPYPGDDSPFGMNHAHPWNSQIALVRRAGLLWMRDWSLKWQFVEPEKGKFTFAETDAQIDRPLALGEKMDLLLPFPSANWSSTAPGGAKAAKSYPANREAMAYAPRDAAEFADYVAACVEHYKDRAKTWEILNEPLYTSYALPPKLNYKPAVYLELLKAAWGAAKKADPDCFVIGGVAGNGSHLEIYEELIQGGALDFMDALDIHVYPGLTPPEAAEKWLSKLNELMRGAGKLKPMWLTEYGYYADDELPRPIEWEMPVLESEMLCAAYYVRINTIALANNVAKLFYHAGSCPSVNSHGLEGIFLDTGNAPRKMLAAQSALADLLGPRARFVEKLETPAGLRAYLFQNAAGPLLIAWAEEDRAGRVILADVRLQGFDIQGNPLRGRELKLTEYPIYVQCPRLSAADAKSAIRIE